MTAFRYTLHGLTLAVLCLLMTAGSPHAQDVNVAPGFGTLNQAIAGGSAGTTFVLARGGLYILDGELETTYPLSIVAEDGDGARPEIILGVASGGETPPQALRPRADFTLRGIHVEGRDELGGLTQRVIRISENEVKVTVEDSWLNNATQAAFRFDGTGATVHLISSTVSNMGRPESPENGRVFDDRGNDIDSLVVENNTFYNILFNVLRDGGGNINYAKFNHNTFYNIGMFTVDFGPVQEAIFRNNLVVNGAFYGVPRPDLNLQGMIEIDEIQGSSEPMAVDIRNNAFYFDPALVAAFPDGMEPIGLFNETAQGFIDEAGTGESNVVLTGAVPFVDPPPAPISTVESFYTDPTGPQAQLDVSGEPYDFAYSESASVYTMATDGGPLGALTWFGIYTVSGEPGAGLPVSFRIESAYPNPFQSAMTLAFRIERATEVRVDVFDLLGRRVRTDELGVVVPGTHRLDLDGSGLNSGVYVVRLTAGADTQALRVTLVK